MDHSSGSPVRVFESGAILMYLAQKFDAFLPKDAANNAECLSWLFWQMGSAPYLGGGFGHFYAYAPMKIKYCIDRYAMEAKRQMDVLNQNLAQREYICGADYTIADMAIWPWYQSVVNNLAYQAAEFLQVQDYTHLVRWVKLMEEREAVQRGKMVNRAWGEPNEQLRERHAASDFELRTWDKIAPEESTENAG